MKVRPSTPIDPVILRIGSASASWDSAPLLHPYGAVGCGSVHTTAERPPAPSSLVATPKGCVTSRFGVYDHNRSYFVQVQLGPPP